MTKRYEVFNYETLEYKLKGECRFHKNKIIAMRDSTILLNNDQEIKLGQIKVLRLRKNVHLIHTLQGVFLGGAIAYIGLNTVNNVITDTSPVFNEKAAYVSVGLLATSLLIRELGIKRIMTKNKDLKILSIDFEHLNEK